jgi:hypothetical protein
MSLLKDMIWLTPVASFITAKFILDSHGFAITVWTYVVLCLLSYPMLAAGCVMLRNTMNKRRAMEMDARVIRRASGNYLGNMDILLRIMRTFNHYVGKQPRVLPDPMTH